MGYSVCKLGETFCINRLDRLELWGGFDSLAYRRGKVERESMETREASRSSEKPCVNEIPPSDNGSCESLRHY